MTPLYLNSRAQSNYGLFMSLKNRYSKDANFLLLNDGTVLPDVQPQGIVVGEPNCNLSYLLQ